MLSADSSCLVCGNVQTGETLLPVEFLLELLLKSEFQLLTGGSDKDPVLRDKMDTNKEATRNKNKTTRHRIHRSAVRPFFCCGSQLSLNSITGRVCLH